METRERIISAYNYLKNVGIISSQQNVADKMGVRKESVSKAFSGNKSYLTNTFILKFNNAFDNMLNIYYKVGILPTISIFAMLLINNNISKVAK